MSLVPRVNHVVTDAPSWVAEQHAVNPHAPHQTDLLNRFSDVQRQMSRCTMDYLYLFRNLCALYPTRVNELFGGGLSPADISMIGAMSHLDIIDMQHSTAPFFTLETADIMRHMNSADAMGSLRTIF